MVGCSQRVLAGISVLVLGICPAYGQSATLEFTDVTEVAGVAVEHEYTDPTIDLLREVAGGAAGADVDGDGWPDLYVVGGDARRQYLFRNRGDGTFAESAIESGVDLSGEHLFGPAFADIDGNRTLDLFVGSFSAAPALFLNDGAGRFAEVARARQTFPPAPYMSASFGDYDGDGDLDMFTTHWLLLLALGHVDHLWKNDGFGGFTGATEEAGLILLTEDTPLGPVGWSFTGNFADIDNDGDLDVLLASDFGRSQVFRNIGGGRFEDISTNVLTEENGMGAAVGDFDNDGDMDWFVTSIFDESPEAPDTWGHSGNRLYRNVGGGQFEDATEEAGVRDGGWGWGACFADFDNDGNLDLFHVNGYRTLFTQKWLDLPARMFLNQGDGTFRESAAIVGIADRGNGRGVVCFDYDRDGDVDVFISNIEGPVRLYRNDTANGNGFLQVRLVGRPPNTEGIGARISIDAGGTRRIREIQSGNNYLSQNPAVAHFGLGDVTSVDEIRIVWPLGSVTVRTSLIAGREIVVPEVDGDANCDGVTSAADLVSLSRSIVRGAGQAPCPVGDVDLDGRVDEADRLFALGQLYTP